MGIKGIQREIGLPFPLPECCLGSLFVNRPKFTMFLPTEFSSPGGRDVDILKDVCTVSRQLGLSGGRTDRGLRPLNLVATDEEEAEHDKGNQRLSLNELH